jgi:hypothetical protein
MPPLKESLFMKRAFTCAGVLAMVFTMAAVRNVAQAQKASSFNEQIQPGGFSVVVNDTDKASKEWADVFGVPPPVPFIPQKPVYPPSQVDKPPVGPKIVIFRLANWGFTLHQPPPGGNYWRDLLQKHGETLYRFDWLTDDLEGSVKFLEARGGKLGLGDGVSAGYINVNLWPKFGFATEINTRKPTQSQQSHPVVLVPEPKPQDAPKPPMFAANPISSIAFVVPNLDQAMKEYADVFNLPAGAAKAMARPAGFPAKSAELRLTNGQILELNEPQGGQNIFRSRLQKDGTSMFCINFKVKSVKDSVAYLKSKGGTLVFGGDDKPYAYVDMHPRLGAMFEVHE